MLLRKNGSRAADKEGGFALLSRGARLRSHLWRQRKQAAGSGAEGAFQLSDGAGLGGTRLASSSLDARIVPRSRHAPDLLSNPKERVQMENFQECITALDRCAAACDICASACLGEGHIAEMEKCIRLDADCAALCRFTSAALARQSQSAQEFCQLCARVCDACAEECGRHSASHCQACSDACRACAEACRTI